MIFQSNIIRWWRIGNFFYRHKLKLFCRVFGAFFRIAFPATDIPFSAKLGENIVFTHRAIGVIIHGDAIVGDNTKIQANVCIGGRYLKGVPSIGKNVLIGAGALVLGGVNVGDDAMIGAGSVVIHDVPEGKVVVGNPARVIKDVSPNLIGKPKI